MERDVAKHLVKTYGTAATRIAKLGKENKLNKRLSKDYSFLEAEVLYSIRSELALKPNDVVCRRVPVSFIDTAETRDVILPKVIKIFAKEFKWSKDKASMELKFAQDGLLSMN
jgi:glycerol-3-phosphate dehydrogenase